MTMWAVTQTHAVQGRGGGRGDRELAELLRPEPDRHSGCCRSSARRSTTSPQVYAQSSPITFIKKVKTPTLVLHGDRDSEVPTPQGYEFWHALKALGVPTELVIYRDEGHAIRDPNISATSKSAASSPGSTSTSLKARPADAPGRWSLRMNGFSAGLLGDRSILVTGGGSGLGLAMAKAFVFYGAKVTIAGRKAERPSPRRRRRSASAALDGGEVDTFAADVREPDQESGRWSPRGPSSASEESTGW